MNTLVLLRQSKLHHLLPGCTRHTRLEASGVAARGDQLYVIFDNLGKIARIEQTILPDGDHGWLDEDHEHGGFEDITYSEDRDGFFALIEAVPTGDGSHQAEVVEYDARFIRQARHRLSFDLETGNKGFEGLVSLRRGDRDYILALCEGNSCKPGEEGRQPGNGQIHIFSEEGGSWVHVECLHVPPFAAFIDYSAIDIRHDRVAILSQESAQLWIGTLAAAAWEFLEDGIVYDLPLHDSGAPHYCNAEGIAWIGPNQVAITSDRKKRGSRHCGRNDESIHLFALPAI